MFFTEIIIIFNIEFTETRIYTCFKTNVQQLILLSIIYFESRKINR